MQDNGASDQSAVCERGRSNEHRKRFRAEIILLRLQGVKIEDVATRLNTSLRTVSIWSSRFEAAGLARLDDKAGQGRRPSLPEAKVARVIAEATRPPRGRSRWSVRSMAHHAGVSPSTVQRIWANNDLKPHITKTFKQALERSQPGLPLAPRHPCTRTHDYKRHGTVTLFAALDYLEAS
jgi:AraC-like DNA-binding protein